MRLNCHISVRVKGCCDTCGNWPNHLHMPEEMHGWYCGRCCPACKARAAELQRQGPQPQESAAEGAPAYPPAPPEGLEIQAHPAPQAA